MRSSPTRASPTASCASGCGPTCEAILPHTDVLLMTSRSESFCLAALEAAACGVPTVAPRVGGLPELVRDGVSGLLFEDGDEDAGVDALVTLLQDDLLRARMGRAARAVATEFAATAVVPRYEALYRELLGRAATGSDSATPRTDAVVRELSDLLADDAGRALLLERGMHTDPGAFAALLSPPPDGALNELLGLPADAPLVHIGQQACADIGPTVAAKFAAADTLGGAGATPAVLWHDLDRAGSERRGMRVVLPSGKKTRGVWLAHRSLGDRETRFIDIDADDARAAVRRAARVGRQQPPRRPRAGRRPRRGAGRRRARLLPGDARRRQRRAVGSPAARATRPRAAVDDAVDDGGARDADRLGRGLPQRARRHRARLQRGDRDARRGRGRRPPAAARRRLPAAVRVLRALRHAPAPGT